MKLVTTIGPPSPNSSNIIHKTVPLSEPANSAGNATTITLRMILPKKNGVWNNIPIVTVAWATMTRYDSITKIDSYFKYHSNIFQ